MAREIFNSEIPIISAVGHEIDFTIADYVADLRAPTPSAAAELAVPNSADILHSIKSLSEKIRIISLNQVYNSKLNLKNLENTIRSYHPRNILQSYQQRLDEANLKIEHQISQFLTNYRSDLSTLQGQLKELSPYNALKRGYSILRQRDQILNSVYKIQKDEKVNILLSDGSLDCRVDKIHVKNE